MTRSLTGAPIPSSVITLGSPEDLQRNISLGCYAVGVLALSGTGSEFSRKVGKGFLSRTFLQSDPTLAFALEFVKEYTFSYDELKAAGWDRDHQDQNELVRAFASEALAHTASVIDKTQPEYHADSELVKNTISIGQLNGDVDNPSYATVLVEGANRGIWGSFENEPDLVRELFRLNKRENQRIAPVLLAHRGIFNEALDTREGRNIGREYFERNIQDDIPHFLNKNDATEVNKIQILLAMADASPGLFAYLTSFTMYALNNAEYYPRQIGYEDSTLGGLAGELLRMWQEFPEKYNGRMAEIRSILEHIHLVSSKGAHSEAVKPMMDQLQAIIKQKLSV